MHDLAAEFSAERDHLLGVAYRMLGSRTEAEDAVQEAWLRCSGALADERARADIRNLRAWLTTTVARICLDVLRSARVRREAYVGPWLPEPVVTRLPGGAASGFAPDPAERAAKVARFLLGAFQRVTGVQGVRLAEPVLVNGSLGLLMEVDYTAGRRLRLVAAFAIDNGRITGVLNQLNPEKLAAAPVPDPTRAGWPPELR